MWVACLDCSLETRQIIGVYTACGLRHQYLKQLLTKNAALELMCWVLLERVGAGSTHSAWGMSVSGRSRASLQQGGSEEQSLARKL